MLQRGKCSRCWPRPNNSMQRTALRAAADAERWQLSPMSSDRRVIRMAPGGVGAEHGVENREELAHTGRESHLLRLAGSEEALVKLANYGIAPGGHQRGHVKRRANRSAATPDEAFAPERAAIAGQWGHPDEGRDLFAGQRTEFGQIPDQRATDDGPDAGDRAQKILFGPPDGAGLDSTVQVVINIVELALKPTDVLDDAPADSRHGVLETVAFGAHHPEDLTPPRQQ